MKRGDKIRYILHRRIDGRPKYKIGVLIRKGAINNTWDIHINPDENYSHARLYRNCKKENIELINKEKEKVKTAIEVEIKRLSVVEFKDEVPW